MMEKTNNPGGKKKKKLTRRESTLLFVLLIAVVLFLYAYFFLLPTMDRIDELEAERNILQVEYDQRSETISRKEEYRAELAEEEEIINESLTAYFPTTNQEHFIKIFETEFIPDNTIDIPALTFNRPQSLDMTTEEEARLVDYYYSRVFLPYEGDYDGVIELVRRLENFGEMIRINNLSITQDVEEDEEYFGNLTIDFFSVPQDYDYPWEVQVPDYSLAAEYDRSLFYFSAEDLPPDEDEIDDDEEQDNGENDNGNGNDTEVDDDPEDDDEADDDDEDSDAANYITYLVQPGDTLNQISNDFYGTTAFVPEIMRLNNITDPRRLLWGTTIRLPRP